MPDTTVRVEYIGAVQNFSEVTITGNQQVWRIGSSAFVETGRASQLVASGKFRSLANDPAMLPANQAKVGAIPSSGGNGIPTPLRGARAPLGSRSGYLSGDILADLMPWMRPRHLPIVDPNLHIGMAPITNGIAQMTHVASEPTELGGSALQMAISGAGTGSINLPLPAAEEFGVKNYAIRAAGQVHIRVSCSDWSKVTLFYVNLAQNGGFVNMRKLRPVNASKSPFGCTDPAYADRWNNTYRTMSFDGSNHISAGSPTPWGESNVRYFDVTGVQFIAIVTGAVTFKISRIYSPDWPISLVTPIYDGWYKSVRERVMTEWVARGWGAGGSAHKVEDMSDPIYPTYAQLKELSTAGFDVFGHCHAVDGGTSNPVGLSASITETQFLKWLTEQRRALLDRAQVDPRGMRRTQFIQNNGQYVGNYDMAGLLRRVGVTVSRGSCSDAQWGFNPHNTTYASVGSIRKHTYLPQGGFFNRQEHPIYGNMNPGSGYDSTPIDAAFPTPRGRLDFAAECGTPFEYYHHQINPTPTAVDVTPEFFAAQEDHLWELEKAGKILIVAPSVLDGVTVNRTDDVFMRWDGEWAYRHDPTRIAF